MHYKEVKGILSNTNGMNIYRGCSHGCIYCDSRSKCYQFDHEFEDIEIKSNCIELLERKLSSKRKKCMIQTGSMSDPYLHLEKELGYTRRVLKTVLNHGFGISVLTKSNMVLRDLDLLKEINKKSKCVVQMTLTTYDEDLCKIVEPNVSTTKERFEVLKTMRDNGIPTVVWLGPILPFINDSKENLIGILNYCVEAGVYGIICFGMGLTLRDGNREYYYEQLDKKFPGLKDKYIKRYGNSYEVNSNNNHALMNIFKEVCDSNGIVSNYMEIFKYLQEFPEDEVQQLTLF